MTDLYWSIIGVLTLPIGTLLIVHYVTWKADRDLAQSHREHVRKGL